jgi:hypothetical protein
MRTAISPRLAIRILRIICQKSEEFTIIIIDCGRDRNLDNEAVVSRFE